MAYYLEFDGVDDYVSIPKLQSANFGGYSWSLEFRAHNSTTDEFIVIGDPDGTEDFIILRKNNSLDYRINSSSNFFNVSDVRDPDAIYRLDWEIDTLSVYENNVFIRAIPVSTTTPIGGNSNNFSIFGLARGDIFRAGVLHYLKYTDNNDNLNSRFYKKETLISNNDTVFPDIINSNDGTLVNFPTNDSQWVFYSSGGTGVSADAAFELPKLTLSASGSATLPQPTANGAFTLNLLTASASGTATLPQPDISGAFSLQPLTVSASGSATLPQPNVTGAFSVPLLTLSGDASATLPQPIANGAFNIPIATVSGFATISGLTLIIDRQTNINQQFLSANIKQQFLNNNIIFH